MRTMWGYPKNRSALATCAVLTVALLGMGILLWSSTATAGYPAEDTRMAPLANEPGSPLRDVIVEKLKTQDRVKLDNLLQSYPPNESFNVSKGIQETTLIESLCGYIGKKKVGSYTLTAGHPVCIEKSCPIDPSTDPPRCICEEEVTVGPCNSGGCMGRCGPGCGSPPGPETQRFTQACLNHDLCTRATGFIFGDCTDEWLAAADDFLFGHNCAEDADVVVGHISSGSGCNTNVPVKFKVKNIGQFYDTYNLEAVCAPWPCPAWPSSVGPMASGAERLVTVYVSIPGPCDGEQVTGSTTLEATSQCNPDASDFASGSPTLVETTSFIAIPHDGYVLVEWETASEVDTEGFNIWRSETEDGQYIKLNETMIPPQGSPVTGASYSYIDDTVINGVTYYYKLEDVDIYGTSTFHGPVPARPSRVFRTFVPLVVKGQ